MITFDLNLQQIEVDVPSRTMAVISPVEGSEFEFVPLNRGEASDPLTEYFVRDEMHDMTASVPFSQSLEQWTSQDERHFGFLAEREAMGQLNMAESVQLERLSNRRRAFKNSRTGEELVWEYEQRKRTRELVEALTRYVSFHQTTRRTPNA